MTALFWFTQPGFTQNSVNLKEMQQLADQSNVEAQYNMGVIYDHGINIPKNGSKAVEYYTKSPEQGYADVLFNLGELYRQGDYVKQDRQKAIEYYQKAVQHGSATPY